MRDIRARADSLIEQYALPEGASYYILVDDDFSPTQTAYLYNMANCLLLAEDVQVRKLDKLCSLVDDAYAAMHTNLATPLVQLEGITNAEEAEENVNAYRDMLREEHLSNVEKANYPYETGAFYMDVVNALEKMGDFIINISQAQISAKPEK